MRSHILSFETPKKQERVVGGDRLRWSGLSRAGGGWLGSLGAHQLLAQTQSHSHASKTKTKENLDHTNYWRRVTHQLTYTQLSQPHSLCIFWQKVADPLFVFLAQSSWSSSLALVQLHVGGNCWQRVGREMTETHLVEAKVATTRQIAVITW